MKLKINAHSLIYLIVWFRVNKNLNPEIYTIWNFSNQPVSNFSEQLGHLQVLTLLTVVNFFMKDIMSRL